MPDSTATICNMALVHLGLRGVLIDSLDTPGDSEEAAVCKVFYDTVRDAVLTDFPWPFATLRASLTQLDVDREPPRDGWLYVFDLPSACLQPREVWPVGADPAQATPETAVSFLVEKASFVDSTQDPPVVDDSQVLLCNIPDPVLRYTARIVDPTRFPSLFSLAFSWLLAAHIAPSLAKTEKADLAMKMYQMVIGKAQVAAFAGQREPQTPSTESVLGRL